MVIGPAPAPKQGRCARVKFRDKNTEFLIAHFQSGSV
jgi:hypothetical protein